VEELKLDRLSVRLPLSLMGNWLHRRLRAQRWREETEIMWEREGRQKKKG